MNRSSEKSLRDLAPDTELPWLMRLRPLWGWILTFIFGCGGAYVAYLQYGWQSLHGLWSAILLLVGYYYLQLHLRLKIAVGKLISSAPTLDVDAIEKRLVASAQQQIGSELESKISDLQSQSWRLRDQMNSLRRDFAYAKYRSSRGPAETLDALIGLIGMEDNVQEPSRLPEWLDHIESILGEGDVSVGSYTLQDLESCLERFADTNLRSHVTRIRRLLAEVPGTD